MPGRKTTPSTQAPPGGASPAPAHKARISKKLLPGQSGTKRHCRQFGDALVCVRYRHDERTGKRYSTVEIVVDVHEPPVDTAARLLDHDEIIAAHVDYYDIDLRARVQAAGVQWDRQRKVWLMPYGVALRLGLHGRAKLIGKGDA